eukprot:s3979_g2.t1
MERVQDTADRDPTKRCSTVAVAASSFITARDAGNRCIKLVVLTNCVIQKRDLLPPPLNLSLCVSPQYSNRCLSQQKPEGCCTKSGPSVAQAAQRKIRRAPVVGLGSVEGKMWLYGEGLHSLQVAGRLMTTGGADGWTLSFPSYYQERKSKALHLIQ